MWPNPQFPADLVTFTEQILNVKLHFLCSDANKETTMVICEQNSTLTYLIVHFDYFINIMEAVFISSFYYTDNKFLTL